MQKIFLNILNNFIFICFYKDHDDHQLKFLKEIISRKIINSINLLQKNIFVIILVRTPDNNKCHQEPSRIKQSKTCLILTLAQLTEEVNYAYKNNITNRSKTPQANLNRYSSGHAFALFINILCLINIIRKGFDLMVSYKKYSFICKSNITTKFNSNLVGYLNQTQLNL